MYRVLKPVFERTGEVTRTADGKDIQWQCVSRWIELGTATGMEDAKRQFGGSPVLEWVKG